MHFSKTISRSRSKDQLIDRLYLAKSLGSRGFRLELMVRAALRAAARAAGDCVTVPMNGRATAPIEDPHNVTLAFGPILGDATLVPGPCRRTRGRRAGGNARGAREGRAASQDR